MIPLMKLLGALEIIEQGTIGGETVNQLSTEKITCPPIDFYLINLSPNDAMKGISQ